MRRRGPGESFKLVRRACAFRPKQPLIRRDAEPRASLGEWSVESMACAELLRVLELAAQSDGSTILGTAETGDRQRARRPCAPRASSRHPGPFVAVDCGVLFFWLPESMTR